MVPGLQMLLLFSLADFDTHNSVKVSENLQHQSPPTSQPELQRPTAQVGEFAWSCGDAAKWRRCLSVHPPPQITLVLRGGLGSGIVA